MTIIMATVESLKRINDDEKAMDDEVQAGIVFPKKFEVILKLNSAVNIV